MCRASGSVGRSADDCGNLGVRKPGDVVIRDRLALLGWERAECSPEAVIGRLRGAGRRAADDDVCNRYRPTALGTQRVNRLVVGDRDKPSLDIRAVGKVWIGTQGCEKGFRPGVISVLPREQGTTDTQHGRTMLCHDLFKRPSHPHQCCRRWHGAKREISWAPHRRRAALDTFDLSGRIALVTGSSRGIGRTLAAGLADAGATVVLNGKHAGPLHEAQHIFLERYGPDRVFARAFDVTEELQIVEAVNWIEDHVGPIRILINNAGIQHRVALLELDHADWEQMLRVNLSSAFLVGREAARRMIIRGRGKIINIASVQSELARPTIAAYTTAKGGLRNLTRAMAAEWAAAGLQINALAPGYIHTEMTQHLVDDQAFNAWVLGRTPAGRWGSSTDLVGPAIWLASDGSDYVNGQVIYVDGGMTVVL